MKTTANPCARQHFTLDFASILSALRSTPALIIAGILAYLAVLASLEWLAVAIFAPVAIIHDR